MIVQGLLNPDYNNLGLIRLRGQPNDELLMAIALAQIGVAPVENPGSFYADFQWWPAIEKAHLLGGKIVLSNPKDHPRHQVKYPSTIAEPVILHFLGHHVRTTLYKKTCLAYKLANIAPGLGSLAKLAYLPRRR